MLSRHQTEPFLPWKQKNIPISAKKACRTPLWNPAGFAVCPPGAALYAALIRACFSDHHPQSIAVYKKVFEISDDISYNNQVRYVQAVF